MNVLFLTISPLQRINYSGIYTDLMRKFRDEGHEVYIMSSVERRLNIKTNYKDIDGVHILSVRTLNLQKTNVVEKGIGQVMVEPLFKSAYNKFLNHIKIDLILYTTPPISLVNVIKTVKKNNPQAVTYLLLKDIFPQNAVDIGMLSKSGVKGLFYQSFRRQEKELYRISDWIGCMSPANVKYLLEHNPCVNPANVEVAPNSYEMNVLNAPKEDCGIRAKYNLPSDKPIFIYGGNLGKPQGIPFLIECLKANKDRTDCHFVIVGSGFNYPRIEKWVTEEKPKSVSLFKFLPKSDYDLLANACDVGLIFLDYRFTIPNYPSRLLPYLMSKKPIIACTDPNCDTGALAEENGYGYWCPSNSVEAFTKTIDNMLSSDIKTMGENGYQFFLNNYTSDHTYRTIIKHCVK